MRKRRSICLAILIMGIIFAWSPILIAAPEAIAYPKGLVRVYNVAHVVEIQPTQQHDATTTKKQHEGFRVSVTGDLWQRVYGSENGEVLIGFALHEPSLTKELRRKKLSVKNELLGGLQQEMLAVVSAEGKVRNFWAKPSHNLEAARILSQIFLALYRMRPDGEKTTGNWHQGNVFGSARLDFNPQHRHIVAAEVDEKRLIPSPLLEKSFRSHSRFHLTSEVVGDLPPLNRKGFINIRQLEQKTARKGRLRLMKGRLKKGDTLTTVRKKIARLDFQKDSYPSYILKHKMVALLELHPAAIKAVRKEVVNLFESERFYEEKIKFYIEALSEVSGHEAEQALIHLSQSYNPVIVRQAATGLGRRRHLSDEGQRALRETIPFADSAKHPL